jgi:hypothetical protein
MRREITLAVMLVSSLIPHLASFGQPLPTFEDFRRIDRMRRLTGQLQTAELLDVTRIDPNRILRVVEQNPADTKLIWGAAEVVTDWRQKRALFEAALQAGLSNDAVLVRFACAAAQNRDIDLARRCARQTVRPESTNILPWLCELWALRQERASADNVEPPSWAKDYQDYSADAARERVRVLEAAGYSPYAARRLGFMPDMSAVSVVKELSQPPISTNAAPVLLQAARAMQQRPPYLLIELAGQTLERTVLALRADVETSPEVRFRAMELETRREELKTLLTHVERNAVDYATENEMVRYFDEVLNAGEETAMRHLAESVHRVPSEP